MKKRVLSILVLLFAAAAIFPESRIAPDFKQFAPASVGIYTEPHEDTRIAYFEALLRRDLDFRDIYWWAIYYKKIYAFKDYLCQYTSVTPSLTFPGSPLEGKDGIIDENKQIDTLLSGQLASFAGSRGWETRIIDDFAGGRVKDLVKQAREEGLDAVLLVRYYPIRYYIHFSGYEEHRYAVDMDSYEFVASANIGDLQDGLGLLPALELYDTRTGLRLWYSAYYTSHIETDRRLSQDEYSEVVKEFFVTRGITTLGEDGKLIRKKVYSDSLLPEKAAIQTMIDITLAEPEEPFPQAPEDGSRDDGYVRSRKVEEALKFTFWADNSPLTNKFRFFSLGYMLNRGGDLDIYYDLSDLDAIDPARIRLAEDVLSHRIVADVLAYETHNIAIEPYVFFDYFPPWNLTLNYTDDGENLSAEVAYRLSSFGAGLNLKYFIRLSEQVSIFAAGSGQAEWWNTTQNSETDRFYNGNQLYLANIGDRGPGSWFIFNLSASAGIRLFGAGFPLEIYGTYYPDRLTGVPKFSAGIKWYWGTSGTYSTSCAEGISM